MLSSGRWPIHSINIDRSDDSEKTAAEGFAGPCRKVQAPRLNIAEFYRYEMFEQFRRKK